MGPEQHRRNMVETGRRRRDRGRGRGRGGEHGDETQVQREEKRKENTQGSQSATTMLLNRDDRDDRDGRAGTGPPSPVPVSCARLFPTCVPGALPSPPRHCSTAPLPLPLLCAALLHYSARLLHSPSSPLSRAMADSLRSSLWARLRPNLGFPHVWDDLSGSVGDLGTFMPIVLALVLVNGLDLGTTLLFTGAYNVVTGVLFGVPMPVQPMKSIAAVAITEGDPLTVNQIMAAGLSTALVLCVLGITGLMSMVNRLVPLPVVRGVQLSQGIAFGITAVKYILKEQDLTKSKATGDRPWLGIDGLLVALSALCFIVLATGAGGSGGLHECGSESVGLLEGLEDEATARRERRIREGRSVGLPTAFLVFIVGVLLAIARDPSVIWKLQIGPSIPQFLTITKEDWKIGFVRAAIPQIPLSILNSVIAVCKLSHDLFPSKDVSPFKVSVSVGLMNLVGCWWGAMPVCHGAGGLAGQYRFGAKTGTAVVLLGSAKMLLSLVLGTSLVQLLAQYPIGLLGVLLLFSGLELAMACRDQTSRTDAFVMLTVTVVSLTNSSSALGFGCGIALAMLLYIREVDFWARLWRRVSRRVPGARRPLPGYETRPPPGYETLTQTP